MDSYVFYGNTLSDWLIALAIAAAAFLGLKLVNTLLVRRLRALAKRPRIAFAGIAADVIDRTSAIVLFTFAIYLGARFLELDPDTVDTIGKIALLALLIQIGLWATVAISRVLEREAEKRLASDAGTATLLGFARLILAVMVWVLLLIVALENLEFDITGLIAGLGIGGIAIAFAVQGVLSDLFASISIVLDKPFVVGDFMIVDNVLGTVEHVGLSTTRVRALSGEQISVPNSDLVKSRIHNYKRMTERRVVFKIGVVYDTPPDKLAAMPRMIREIVEQQEKTRFDRAHFQALGDFSLNFEIVYYVLDPDYNLYMDTQQAINLEIFRRFEAEGIEFAFPTQVLHMHRQEPSSAAAPASRDIPEDVTTRG